VKSLRVMFVLPSGRRGVAERLALEILSLHDPELVTPSVCFLEEGPMVGECADRLGFATAVLTTPRRGWFGRRRVVTDLAAHCRALGIRLVHSLSAAGHLIGGRAAREVGVPSVWSQLEAPSWRRGRDIASALIKTRAIIAHAPSVKLAQERVNPRRAKCVLFPAGTRLPHDPIETRRERGRAALGLGDDAFAVGVFGRIEPASGHDVLLRAGASLCHARSAARILVVGLAEAGALPGAVAALKAHAVALGIGERVRFLERARESENMIAACDVIADASLVGRELPLAVIEAMASGVATLAPDHATVRELVTGGIEAILTPPGDHEALAVALLAMCDDPGHRAEIGAAGEAAVRERFDAERMTRRIEALYRDVATA
jgi:glycosyltransferase involved in cell wall biosynthesis